MQQARSICSQVVGTGYRQCSGGLVPLDLRDEAGLARLIAATQPEVIFLPAAYTNVDQAEADPQTCWAVNVTAVVAVCPPGSAIPCPAGLFLHRPCLRGIGSAAR
jgi:dTDP-4-dehydrorhamnose reductase